MNFDEFMRQMAAEPDGAAVPPASAVWWRAEFRRRFEAEQRAVLPIRIAVGMAYAACVIVAGVLAVGFGPAACIAVGGVTALTACGAAMASRTGSR